MGERRFRMNDFILNGKEITMETERAYCNAEIESMVKEYGNMVFRLALVKTKQRESADDIFQEVFVRLIKLRNPACKSMDD